MNRMTYLTCSGVLAAMMLVGGATAQGQLITKPSDLDIFNSNSGINEVVSDTIGGLPRPQGPVLRPDDPTYITDPGGDVPAAARIHTIVSSESGLWLVPIREQKARNLGNVCLYDQKYGGHKDQTWRYIPTPFGYRIVNVDSGFSLVPIREEVRQNFGRVCLYNVMGPGTRDQSWNFVTTRYGMRIVNAESGLSLVPIREQVRSNFGKLCLYNVAGDGVRDQNWNAYR